MAKGSSISSSGLWVKSITSEGRVDGGCLVVEGVGLDGVEDTGVVVEVVTGVDLGVDEEVDAAGAFVSEVEDLRCFRCFLE